jgi:hypothetical protein
LVFSFLKISFEKKEQGILKMKRKPIMVLICVLFSSLIIMSPQSTSISIKNFLSETIDQNQERDVGPVAIRNIEWQEFVPAVKKLLRVEVKIQLGYGEATPLRLSIEQPLGTVLSSKELPASEIPTAPDWVSFDVQDITLTTGQIYYIKLSTSFNALYYWCGASNNPYPNGVSSKGSDWDWCFRTYVDKSKSLFIDNIHPESRMKTISTFLALLNSLRIISYEK